MGNDKEWKDLTAEEKAAATKCEYTEAIWDGNGKVELEDYDWDELEDEYKTALGTLGITAKDWGKGKCIRSSLA